MLNKTLCLVDENHHIVKTPSKAKAVAFVLENKVVEITFLKPIAFNVARIEALRLVRSWKEKNFSTSNYSASLPECETCQKANQSTSVFETPVFTDCHVVNSCGSSRNPRELTKLDHKGYPVATDLGEKVKYVYVSLLVSVLEFIRQNPQFKIEDYA